jgi:chorismate mutase
MTEDLEVLRARIEELDGAIVRILGERFANVRLLGRRKAIEGVPVEDPEREDELRALYLRAAEREGLAPELVLRVFEVIHDHSKAEQRRQGRRTKTA